MTILSRIRSIIANFATVFEGAADTLPKPFDSPPIKLKFIPNASPKSVPEPRWSCAHGQIVRKWAEDGIANGSLEWSASAWASRPHIVLKPPNGEIAATARIADCKLRVCGDYRMVNTQMQKMAPNLPTGTHQLELASGNKWCWESK